MAVLDELATLLQTAGVGTLGTTLFKSALPLDHPLTDAAPPIVALIEIPGMSPVRSHDNAKYEQPVIQVAVRGGAHGYPAARTKAQAAWDVLDGITNQTLSGVVYLWVQALQSPFFLRLDDLQRPIIVFSIRCARAL